MIPLGLILSELVSNALKYAFAGRGKGTLQVILEALESQSYQLTVTDDGIGLPDGFSPSKAGTLGFNIVNSLIQQISGRLDVETDRGTTFHILFSDRKVPQ